MSSTNQEKQEDDDLFESAVQALFSSLHQSTTKEEIKKAAKRRTQTVNDMRTYWNRIRLKDEASSRMKRRTRRMIHITGTKGKGSTACFCESILRAHGYSTGLFTSPHLIDIRERIRWNGLPIHRNIFGRAYWNIRHDLERAATHKEKEDELPVLPGYFRMLTLMAFYIFEIELDVDVLIFEVGMGGRYDATNFWDITNDQRVACGVTKLDLDHTRILGDTVERIAWEKGGIFALEKDDVQNLSPKDTTEKNGIDLFASQNNATTGHVQFYVLDSNTTGVLKMLSSCASIEGQGHPLKLVDATGIELKNALHDKTLGLAGQHQFGNATLATHLCDAIVKDSYSIKVNDPKTVKGLTSATWPARCQTLEAGPFTFLLDGAHTLDSMQATVDWFDQNIKGKCALVFTCSHERNPIELLQLLVPLPVSKVYFAKSDSFRPSPVAVPTATDLLTEHGITIDNDLLVGMDRGSWQETLGSLWNHLRQQDVTGDVQCNWSAKQVIEDLYSNHKGTHVLVTGSLYLVGSFLTAMGWNEKSSADI